MSIIGRATNRIEGPVKVTGAAHYTADIREPGMLHGMIVPATIPHGSIIAIDTAAAERMPGVIRVITHENMPRLVQPKGLPAGTNLLPMQSSRIVHEGQPVALVLAESLEIASAAARQIHVSYQGSAFQTNFLANLAAAESVPLFGLPPDDRSGIPVEPAMAAAQFRHEATYSTADRHHLPMEPSATLALWRNGRLILRDAIQGVTSTRATIAAMLGIAPEQIDVSCEFTGGGFGCKGFVWHHEVLAAVAARLVKRPVRVQLTRAQTFTGHGFQPASRQTVTLASDAGGKLAAIRHASVLAGSISGDHVEPCGWGTRTLYAAPAIEVTHRVVRCHRSNPTPMRAPIEGVGLVALEIAMDELAWARGINPLALRLTNYAEFDPREGKPFSSKKLRECYSEAARRFDWPEQMPTPGSIRRGNDQIGYGLATALFATFRSAAKARVSIASNSRVRVETGTQEIGGGTYTVLAQFAAEELGVPVERIEVRIGDTRLPEGPMSAGSRVTLSAGSAVQAAARNLRGKLEAAGAQRPDDYAEALQRLGVSTLAAEGEWTPPQESPVSLYSFGAVMAEVAIDVELPIPRVTRVTGVYNAGRIINPKAARGQMTGGIIWGIGQALLEQSEMDHRFGRFLSKNLSGYLVPVNADVPNLDVHFVEDFDAAAGPVGARGIGELGSIAIGPAIANAVYHATRIRVRDMPIRPEMLMDVSYQQAAASAGGGN